MIYLYWKIDKRCWMSLNGHYQLIVSDVSWHKLTYMGEIIAEGFSPLDIAKRHGCILVD